MRDRHSQQTGRSAWSTDLDVRAGELLLMAHAGAPRRFAVADASKQLPPLLGVEPRSIWVALVLHWAALVTPLAGLSPFKENSSDTTTSPHPGPFPSGCSLDYHPEKA